MNTIALLRALTLTSLSVVALLTAPSLHAQAEDASPPSGATAPVVPAVPMTPPRPVSLSAPLPVPEIELDDGSHERGNWQPGPQVLVQRDMAYGADPLQRMDIYRSQRTLRKAPVLLLLHGGGWRRGDKAMPSVVENKVAYWVDKGWVVISVNTRLLPQVGPLMQLQDLVQALSYAQARAEDWGADPDQFVLMGHSAGAHLVALLSANPEQALRLGGRPWKGAVLLDSAALDVPEIMRNRHFRLYDAAFGSDPAYWRLSSPLHQLDDEGPPMLAVCSTRRPAACAQAEQFATAARRLQRNVSILRLDAGHREINQTLGLPGSYTEQVDAFLRRVR